MARSPTGKGPSDRPDFQRDRADLQSLLTTVTATAPTGTFTMIMTSPLRSPAAQTHDPLPFPQSHHVAAAAASPSMAAASAVRQQAWGEQPSSSMSPTRQQQQQPKGGIVEEAAAGIAHRDRVGSAATTDFTDYSSLSPSRTVASRGTGANPVLSPTRSPLVYPKTRATSTTLASAIVAAGPAKVAGSTLSSEAAAALRMADDYLSSSSKRDQQQQASSHEDSKDTDSSDLHTRRRRNTYSGSGHIDDYEHGHAASHVTAYSNAANPPLPRDRDRDLQRLQQQQQQQQQQAEEITKKQHQQQSYYHASVPNTARRDIIDEDEPYANATNARIRDRDVYGHAPAALDKDKAEGGGVFAPVKKRQVTMPKSPKFSKMSWQRKAEAGGVDNNNNNNGIAGGQAKDKDRDRDRDNRERDREREKRKSFGAAVAPAPTAAAAAAVPTGAMRPTSSWKMGYGGGPEAVAPTAKPRASSAGTAMMRQKEKERNERTAKYLDEDNDNSEMDFVEEGLRQLRARRK